MSERFGQIPVGGLVSGLKLEHLSSSQVKVHPGFCAIGNALFIKLTEAITGDITQDLDIGTEEASTWYFVHLCLNPETLDVFLKFSKALDRPAVADDIITKRIGAVRNDANSNLLKFHQVGASNDREYHWLEDRETVLKVLSDGTSQTWQPIDCKPLVPETAELTLITHYETGQAAAEIRPKDETMSTYVLTSYGGDSRADYIKPGTDRLLEYIHNATNGHLYVFVLGFREEL